MSSRHLACFTLVFFAASLLAAPAAWAAGEPDPSFGTAGSVQLAVDGGAHALARDAAGNLYLGGMSDDDARDFLVAKVDANGAPVTGFGTNGVARFSATDDSIDEIYAIAVDAAGNVFVGGDSVLDVGVDLVVAKLDAGGHLATGFGSGGLALIHVAADSDDLGQALLLAPDGSLFIAGSTDANDGGDFVVAKLDASGHLVTGFGNGGLFVANIAGDYDAANALARDPSGNLYVLGTALSNGSLHMAMIELDPSGQRVAAFGDGGTGVVAIGSLDYGVALARGSDGSLYVGGLSEVDNRARFGAAKLDASGHLVAGFGNGGIVSVDAIADGLNYAQALAVDPDGHVYLAGGGMNPDTFDFVAIELDPAGALVGDFGTGGVVTVSLTPLNDIAAAMVLDPSGALYLAGTSDEPFARTAAPTGTPREFAVVKLLTDPANRVFADGFDD